MNICFFLPSSPKGGFNPKLGGGSELALYYLTTQLAKMGVEVHVVIDGEEKSVQTLEGVNVHTQPIPNNPLGAYTSAKSALSSVCTDTGVDVLVGFELSVEWAKATVADALISVAHSGGLKLVYYVGNHYPWLIPKSESNPWLLWRSLKRVVRSAHTLLAASSIMGRAVAREAGVDPARVGIVPFGVPLEEYAPDAHDQLSQRSGVLFVGRIIPHKGLRELVEAARIIGGRGHSLHYTAVGPRGDLWEDYPGSHYRELSGLVELYHLGESFKFTGSLPREEVVRLMRTSRVFAFPSHAEGFGVALIQAMAAGAVPVVYEIEPLTEIVGEAGVYAKLGDPESLAEAIIRAYDDHTLPILVRQRIQNYSIERVAAQFMKAVEAPEERATPPAGT